MIGLFVTVSFFLSFSFYIWRQNLKYGRHWVSGHVRIIAPIQWNPLFSNFFSFYILGCCCIFFGLFSSFCHFFALYGPFGTFRNWFALFGIKKRASFGTFWHFLELFHSFFCLWHLLAFFGISLALFGSVSSFGHILKFLEHSGSFEHLLALFCTCLKFFLQLLALCSLWRYQHSFLGGGVCAGGELRKERENLADRRKHLK